MRRAIGLGGLDCVHVVVQAAGRGPGDVLDLESFEDLYRRPVVGRGAAEAAIAAMDALGEQLETRFSVGAVERAASIEGGAR